MKPLLTAALLSLILACTPGKHQKWIYPLVDTVPPKTIIGTPTLKFNGVIKLSDSTSEVMPNTSKIFTIDSWDRIDTTFGLGELYSIDWNDIDTLVSNEHGSILVNPPKPFWAYLYKVDFKYRYEVGYPKYFTPMWSEIGNNHFPSYQVLRFIPKPRSKSKPL